MFKINDQIEDKDGFKGTITYIDNNIVYVDLQNGAEMEYKLSDIFPIGTHEDKIIKKHNRKLEKKEPIDNPLMEESAEKILKRYPGLTKKAEEFHNSVNKLIGESNTWKTATSQQKLNVFAGMLSLKPSIFYMAVLNNDFEALNDIIKDRLNLLTSLT